MRQLPELCSPQERETEGKEEKMECDGEEQDRPAGLICLSQSLLHPPAPRKNFPQTKTFKSLVPLQSTG